MVAPSGTEPTLINSEAGGQMRQTVVGQASADSSDTSSFSIGQADRLPEQILTDRYIFVSTLGKGGMGAVELWELRSGYGVVHVVKIPHVDHVNRLQREGDLLLYLEGVPGFPVLIDRLKESSGRPCLVMNYIVGETLEKRLANDPDGRNILKHLRVCLGYFEAVATAHERGIIIRDCKPSNIMVCRDTAKPWVIDLGLAKKIKDPDLEIDINELSIAPQSVGSDHLTVAGNVMGSIPYMPPEQALGQVQRHTYRSDIYALGSILYRVVSGVPPIIREMEAAEQAGQALNLEKVVSLITSGTFLGPHPVTSLPRQAELLSIIAKAMKPNMDDRYRTVAHMVRDLNAWFEGNPVEAHRESLSKPRRLIYDFDMWRRRHPKLEGFFATAALGVLALGAGFWARSAARTAQQQERERAGVVVAENLDSKLDVLRVRYEQQKQELLGAPSVAEIDPENLDDLERVSTFQKNCRLIEREVRQEGVSAAEYEEVATTNDALVNSEELLQLIKQDEASLEERIKARRLAQERYAEFRKQYEPVRTFLGFQVGLVFLGVPQHDIDSALATILPSFDRTDKSREGDLFFPDCTESVNKFLATLQADETAGRLSQRECKELQDALAGCLRAKVSSIVPLDGSRFTPGVRGAAETATQYMETAGKLLPSYYQDAVLLQRLDLAKNDPEEAAEKRRIRDRLEASALEAAERGEWPSEDGQPFQDQDVLFIACNLTEQQTQESLGAAGLLLELLRRRAEESSGDGAQELPSGFGIHLASARYHLIIGAINPDQQQALYHLASARDLYVSAITLLKNKLGSDEDPAVLAARRRLLAALNAQLARGLGYEANLQPSGGFLRPLYEQLTQKKFTEAIDNNPTGPAVRDYMMWLLSTERNQEAIVQANKLLELQPELRGNTLFLLIGMQRREGDLQAMCEAADQLRAEQGKTATALDFYGAALEFATLTNDQDIVRQLEAQDLAALVKVTERLLVEVLRILPDEGIPPESTRKTDFGLGETPFESFIRARPEFVEYYRDQLGTVGQPR